MKTLIILALFLVLVGAFFFTRPTKADFETYVRQTTKVVDGKPTGGKTVMDTVGDKIKTFAADKVNESAADEYLSHCTYNNYVVFTNVKHDGKLVYTGALNHWFERGDGTDKPQS